jgi:hypothetical protein
MARLQVVQSIEAVHNQQCAVEVMSSGANAVFDGSQRKR